MLSDRTSKQQGMLRNPSEVVVVARVAAVMSSETGLETGDVIHSVNQVSSEFAECTKVTILQS
jgi:hypothetical protein